jgi:pimeloyl-ACP methyl ester carboxylesterase
MSDDKVREFRAEVTDKDLDDMRKRLEMVRWPDKETVEDQSQGAPLKKMQKLIDYWKSDYDWRKGEAKLNAYPQFMTEIDGVDIHFIHVRSNHKDAMPLIISHGWPGSVFEQIKPIDMLTKPMAHDGEEDVAFHVVIPSLPGYGFSSRPTKKGWDVERIGRTWDVLMKRLGYKNYVAQGGDWGAGVVEAMGRQAPEGLLAIHTNLPAVFPPNAAAATAGGPIPDGLSDEERTALEDVRSFIKNGGWGYYQMMTARPQAVGYGLTDSPAGLAGWMLVHGGFSKWTYGDDPKQAPTVDEVLDNFSLHWLTNTVASGARLYWENRNQNLISSAAQKTEKIKIPVAITVFPQDDLFRAPESWARRAFPSLNYFNVAARGGHFAAWEEPEIFAEEMRAAFLRIKL